jgi:CRP-like cAMP-binding protein
VEIRRFAPRQPIFSAGDPASHGYVVMLGRARVTTTDGVAGLTYL